MRNLLRRKLLDRTMTTLTGVCAVFAVGALMVILAYILIGGVRHLSLGFLVNTPVPHGEPGGGIANAIVGTLILVGLGSLMGMPIGILAGVYLAEFGNNRFGYTLRFLI